MAWRVYMVGRFWNGGVGGNTISNGFYFSSASASWGLGGSDVDGGGISERVGSSACLSLQIEEGDL